MLLRVIIYWVSVIFSGCGGSTEASPSNTGSSAAGSSSECSGDGSGALVPGTYIYALSSSVSSKQKTQVKILKQDCNYCFETVQEGDSDELSVDGTWSSTLGNKSVTSGQEIDVTVGTLVYTLSGDGQTLSYESSTWSKSINSSYTCN